MKKIVIFLTSIILIILQTALLPYFKFFGLNYGLAICSVIVVASIYDTRTAIINSLLCGIMLDTFASDHYGLYLAIFIIIAIFTIFISDFMYKGSLGTAIVITLILTFLSELLLYYIFMVSKGMNYHSYALTRIILPQAFLNAFMSIIIFGIYKNIYKKLKLDKQW